jgi:hypothetical protein
MWPWLIAIFGFQKKAVNLDLWQYDRTTFVGRIVGLNLNSTPESWSIWASDPLDRYVEEF